MSEPFEVAPYDTNAPLNRWVVQDDDGRVVADFLSYPGMDPHRNAQSFCAIVNPAPTPAAPDLRALLIKAAKALEPFGKTPIGVLDEDQYVYETLLTRDPDDTIIYGTHGHPKDQTAVVTVGDLRHARAIAAEIRAALGEG